MHIWLLFIKYYFNFPGSTNGKNLPANAGDVRDTGWIPGSGRSPGRGNGNPLHYSCLENPMDRGAMGLQRARHNWVTEVYTFRYIGWHHYSGSL